MAQELPRVQATLFTVTVGLVHVMDDVPPPAEVSRYDEVPALVGRLKL